MPTPKSPTSSAQKIFPLAMARIPPGQVCSKKFPALSFGPVPHIDMVSWRLHLFGLVEADLEITWEQLFSLPQETLLSDFHCVTRWTRLHNHWEGVLVSKLIGLASVKQEASHVIVHCHGGYTTNLSLETIRETKSILAHSHDGTPLDKDHGWPLRLVVPERYGWKSAKWISGLEFLDHDEPGFWERQGLHMNGDPWREQRYWLELPDLQRNRGMSAHTRPPRHDSGNSDD